MKRFLTLCLMMCLLLAVPVLAVDEAYVYDTAELLTAEEVQLLTQRCAELTERYSCGVYIVTVEDFWDYGDSPYNAATNIYTQLGLGRGEGPESDGVLLMLSMADRDYSLICHGYYGNEVFDEYGRGELEDAFLPYFGDNLWYWGFEAYLDGCDSLFAEHKDTMIDYYGDDYVDYYNTGTRGFADRLAYAVELWLYVIPGAALVALVVCLVMLFGMRTNREATHAGAYIPHGGVKLRVKEDRYSHSTTQVIHHERDTDSGSSSSGGGGGFSGSSGKF